MLRNRLLLSSIVALIIALPLTTLASANAVAVNGNVLHVGTGSPNHLGTYSTYMPAGAIAAPSTSKVKGVSGNFGGTHSTIAFRAKNWNGGSQKAPISTPEPGSLMLLSTGLVGIAGMVRRKLSSPLTVSA